MVWSGKASITKSNSNKNSQRHCTRKMEMCREPHRMHTVCAHVHEFVDRQKVNNYIHIEQYPFPYIGRALSGARKKKCICNLNIYSCSHVYVYLWSRRVSFLLLLLLLFCWFLTSLLVCSREHCLCLPFGHLMLSRVQRFIEHDCFGCVRHIPFVVFIYCV